MNLHRNAKGQFTTKPKETRDVVLLRVGMVFLGIAILATGKAYAIENPIYYERPEVNEITLIETTASSEHVVYHDMAVQVALKYGLDVATFTSVIACESNFNPTIQSNHTYNFNDPHRGIKAGEREMSYGIAQFHIPDWDITIEQAQDPQYALERMAQIWADGGAKHWTCYHQIGG